MPRPVSSTALGLHHELLLLALDEERGVKLGGVMVQQALGGALMAELLLSGRIRTTKDKKRLVDVVDGPRVGTDSIDEAVERIRSAKRRARLQTWVGRLGTKALERATAAELCRRGTLRAEEDKVLLVFTRKIYPERDPKPEREIRARLEGAVFGDARQLTARDAVLVSIAHVSGLLKKLFPKDRLRPRKKHIEAIARGDEVGKATRESIEAVQAAIFAACIVPAIVS